jgi:hypothetical protein
MFKFQITLDRHNPRLMLECDGDTEGDEFMKKRDQREMEKECDRDY